MEALALEKEGYQQTVAESRGQVSTLEAQLGSLRDELKELRQHNLNLEKQSVICSSFVDKNVFIYKFSKNLLL